MSEYLLSLFRDLLEIEKKLALLQTQEKKG